LATPRRTRNTSIKQSITSRLGSMLLSTKTVFLSHWAYIVLAGTIATVFWIVFNIFDQLLFFYPIVTFYLPDDALLDFIFSNITAILLGMVVSMNVYVLKHSRGVKITAASFFSGSSVAVLSSTCASCSSLGFLLISTLGGAGITLSTFLSNYQTPLRLLSIGLLLWAYYSISIRLTKSCKIEYNSKPDSHD
jgi:hypothetical protein